MQSRPEGEALLLPLASRTGLQPPSLFLQGALWPPACSSFMVGTACGVPLQETSVLPVSDDCCRCRWMNEDVVIDEHQLLAFMKSIILNDCGILFLSLYCLLMESLPPTSSASYYSLVSVLTDSHPATSVLAGN